MRELRRPHRDCRRSEGALHPRSCSRACARRSRRPRSDRGEPAHGRRLLVVRLGFRSATSCTPCRPSPRCGAPIRTRRSTGSSTPSHREFLALVPVVRPRWSPRATERCAPGSTSGGVMRARATTSALDFQGLLKSAALARLSGARRVVGFDRVRAARAGGGAAYYTEQCRVGEGRPRHREEPASGRGAWRRPRHRRISGCAGRLSGRWTTLAAPERRAVRADQSAARRGRTSAGRADSVRPAGPAWLRETHGLMPLVLWGPGEESAGADVAASRTARRVAAPPTSLGRSGGAARGRGPGCFGRHWARRTSPRRSGTPVVALFGPTNPARNGPWNAEDERVRVALRPRVSVTTSVLPAAARWCLAGIDEDEVRRPSTRGSRRPPRADRLARWRVPLGFACARRRCCWRIPVWWSWRAGAGVALVGEGPPALGCRPHREGPRNHALGPVPLAYATRSTLGSTLHRSGVRARRQSIRGLAARRGLPGDHARRGHPRRGATLDARFAGGYAAYRAGQAPARLPPLQLAPRRRQSRVPARSSV